MKTIKSKYVNLFDGLGKFNNQYDIKLKENITPIVHAPRKVPIGLKSKLKKALNDMTNQGIISPVKEATDWVSSIVIVDKPNKLRICLDARDLNTAIKRPHYPLPIIEDIMADLSGARIFTVLDVKHGFWHVELTEESSYLTTFNTPFGRYRWKRMPFGVNSANEEF